MKKIFAGTQHYIVLALAKGKVKFPTSKTDILAKAGNESVRLDWDKYIPLSEYCENVVLEHYENKAQFFNAVIATHTQLNF